MMFTNEEYCHLILRNVITIQSLEKKDYTKAHKELWNDFLKAQREGNTYALAYLNQVTQYAATVLKTA